jgi:hypothetical protein
MQRQWPGCSCQTGPAGSRRVGQPTPRPQSSALLSLSTHSVSSGSPAEYSELAAHRVHRGNRQVRAQPPNSHAGGCIDIHRWPSSFCACLVA